MKKKIMVIMVLLLFVLQSIGVSALTFEGSTKEGGVPVRQICANDKYVFAVSGKYDYRDTVISVFDAKTLEYLTEIKVAYNPTTYPTYYTPIRDMQLIDDTLYVTYNKRKPSATSTAPGGAANIYAYDVSEIVAGEVPSYQSLGAHGCQNSDAPYHVGGTTYVDSGVSFKFGQRYTLLQITDLSTNEEMVRISNLPKSTAKLYYNDGYVYTYTRDLEHEKTSADYVCDTLSVLDVGSDIDSYSGSRINKDFGEVCVAQYVSDLRDINDITEYNNMLYLATDSGLDVLDLSAVKAGEADTLEVKETYFDGLPVTAISIQSNYVFITVGSKLEMLDLENNLESVMTVEGLAEEGVTPYDVCVNGNSIYIGGHTSGLMKYSITPIEVVDFKFLKEGSIVDTLSKGNITFEASLDNKSIEDFTLYSIMTLTEDGKLIDVQIDENNLDAGEDSKITGTITIPQTENGVLNVILTDNPYSLKRYEMSSGIYSKKLGASPEVSATYSKDIIFVSEMSEDGKITISGTNADLANENVVMLVINKSAEQNTDRLSAIRYTDIIKATANGEYSTVIAPIDGGEYEVFVGKTTDELLTSETFLVEGAKATLADSYDVPGMDTEISLKAKNIQNAKELQITINYDADVFEITDEALVNENFSSKNESTENGTYSITLTASDALKTNEYLLVVIPTKVKDDAEYDEYDITLNVEVYDKYGNQISFEVDDAVFTIAETSPKFESYNNAVAVLNRIKDATKIEEADYGEQKALTVEAREKIALAVSYGNRIESFDAGLIEKLEASEEKVSELEPKFVALGVLNAADETTISKTLAEKAETLGIENDVMVLYNELPDKTAVLSVITGKNFELPKNVRDAFYEKLLLEYVRQMNWAKLDNALDIMNEVIELKISSYNNITDSTQKEIINKEIARTEFLTVAEFAEKINSLAEDIRPNTQQGTNAGRPSYSSSGSGNSSGGGKTLFVEENVKDAPIPPANAQQEEMFTDLEDYDWAKPAIEALAKDGVTNGKGGKIFAPKDNVTREEFAKMVVLAFNIEDNGGAVMFKDVSSEAWYYDYVRILTNAGIINGYDEFTFGTGNIVTRQDAAVMLLRAAEYKKISLAKTREYTDFTDEYMISDYAKKAIKELYESGKLNGYGDGIIGPKDCMQRAMAAKLIYEITT